MIKLTPLKLNLDICEAQLNEFKDLLDENIELKEGGPGGLLEFFGNRPHLVLLIGKWRFAMDAAFYQRELNIFNEFRADFSIADSKKQNYLFIELEPAKNDSIFVEKENSGSIRFEWSPRYEHGLSQVIDWFYRLDDYERTYKMEEHFGHSKINYSGLLIIGRDCFVNEAGSMQRFNWRKEKTVINNNKIHCITYDQLYIELEEKLFTIRAEVEGYL